MSESPISSADSANTSDPTTVDPVPHRLRSTIWLEAEQRLLFDALAPRDTSFNLTGTSGLPLTAGAPL